ncbi:hypothetical protein COV82_00875 [Candidatus Peregrinibacteria bacterium CG11_big_fil_rev_8_21_14_0_20_46_8]|nr:MAG: hypothetical protein COV82_00875 [Candidatus Peregrinibacteria bacterium CG11_big_fil_rev_8_21_14_0_20_46_8]
MNRAAYSIIELLVVVAILLILAAVAVGTANGVLAEQRMNNAYNAVTNLIQEARGNALASKDSQIAEYRITIPQPLIANPNQPVTVVLSSVSTSGAETQLERIDLGNQGLDILFYQDQQQQACNLTSRIMYQTQTGTPIFECAVTAYTGNLNTKQIRIEIRERNQQNPRQRLFTIHRASGTPQFATP